MGDHAVVTRQETIHRIWITFGVTGPLVGVIAAMYLSWNTFVFPSDLWLLGILYVLTALGVTIGYHRLLTHDSFKTIAPIRALFIILGVMAFEGPPITWAATHIKHHAHSDEEHDPHSPLDGFWHAHFGWLYLRENFQDAQTYAPHLLNDPMVRFINRWSVAIMMFSLFLPLAIGGWTGFIWGSLVRIFLVHHVTWSVNSVCHTFGKRAFETTDESHNEWIVGLLAFGEGWHNNHHAFPRNAFHGMKWYQVDLSGLLIRGLEAVGLAWDVQRVSAEMADAHRVRTQKSAPVLQDLRAQLQQMLENAETELQRLISEYINKSTNGMGGDITRLHAFQAEAQRRLQTIRSFLTKATHMKKQKLAMYLQEAQQIANRAKEEWARLRHPVAISS